MTVRLHIQYLGLFVGSNYTTDHQLGSPMSLSGLYVKSQKHARDASNVDTSHVL